MLMDVGGAEGRMAAEPGRRVVRMGWPGATKGSPQQYDRRQNSSFFIRGDRLTGLPRNYKEK
jgi:hypothetical protein